MWFGLLCQNNPMTGAANYIRLVISKVEGIYGITVEHLLVVIEPFKDTFSISNRCLIICKLSQHLIAV